MPAFLGKCFVVSVSGAKYYFRHSANYGAAKIAGSGVKPIDPGVPADVEAPLIPMQELIRARIVGRFEINIVQGTKHFQREIIISAASDPQGLINQDYVSLTGKYNGKITHIIQRSKQSTRY